MRSRSVYKLFFTLIFIVFQGLKAQERPNIIFILADDFGYESVNCYGADKAHVRTPHINQLAKDGMVFTDASTPASICTPTRYGFLTGRYPWRTSLKFGVNNVKDPLLIDESRKTIADILKDKGYQTAAIGKWHLGYGSEREIDYTSKLAPGPLELGFDYHFGIPQNHDDLLGIYVENHNIYGLRSKQKHAYSKSFYGKQYEGFDAPQRVNIDVMEDLTNKSIEWIRKQDKDTPFFLYFAPIAVHHPITPSDYMRGMSGVGPYGDFIQDLDWSVGKIIETLEYMGLHENTLIIFTSDNGGDIPNQKERPESVSMTYGFKPNGDLKGDKHTIWEGGTRVPFIMNWQGYIEPGTQSDDMINLLDVFATVADITGVDISNATVAPDSVSFISSIKNSENNTRESMITQDASGMHAIRIGDWKYIDDTLPEGLAEVRPHVVKNFVPQLYNLKEDPKETNNVLDKHPKMAKKLKAELEKIRSKE